MNKMAKGAIATAAGVVLLIGGGGTLALWQTDAEAEAGTITAGNMTLSAQGEGVWTVNGGTQPIKIGEYPIVPGDTVTFTQTLTADLDGQNLVANLSVSGLEDDLSEFDSLDISEPRFITVPETGTGTSITQVSVGVTKFTGAIDFTFEDVDELIDATEVHDLGQISFSLQQVRP
ncbi:alternate-type signal peptide domain-containing protein [Arthrobacter sp. JZ12]|uniref:alternate-type signal peptide domain-containing protein n=1 Tax=Arthrobacter sp. JZ12 TaxID=2654190 RepID=UPI002B498257|nr:alternate-type signal peptide domain-containing protein [Arthrobacter sp. JZ12]WRH24474.1 alternate-type signal peptide domain-containing protein [Arthrobacter sp. JZ12]